MPFAALRLALRHLLNILKGYSMFRLFGLALLAGMLGLASSSRTNAQDKKEKALWDRLGGEKAVKVVVHDFVAAAAPDKKVNFDRNGKYKFTAKDIEHLEDQLVHLISAVTGGPLKYTGKSMKDSHKGMAITEEEFKAIAGHLVDTLKKHKVPQKEIDELIKIVASTHDDIVEKKK